MQRSRFAKPLKRTRPAAPTRPAPPARRPAPPRDPYPLRAVVDPAFERIRAAEAAARLREEERKAILARVAKVPAANRARVLEEERIVAWGRSWAAKLKNKPEVSAEWAREVFGIEIT